MNVKTIDTVNISLPSGATYELEKGLSLAEISGMVEHGCKWPITIAKVDNDFKELTFVPESDCMIEFFDTGTKDGMRVYKRTAIMMLIMAIQKVLHGSEVRIMQSLSNALYCEVDGVKSLTAENVEAIEDEMWNIVRPAHPIVKNTLPVQDAMKIYRRMGLYDKVELLKYRNMPEVNTYTCMGYTDYFYGFMAPDTSYVNHFRLNLYSPGLILELPSRLNPLEIPEYEEQGQLPSIYFAANKWGKTVGVKDIASLNRCVEAGRFKELVLMCEAFQEKRISLIADEILENRDRIAVVLIAGPSSSGKTTFAKRLSIQLKVNGINPIAISMDDYFINRCNCPVDEEGNPDLESVETIDIPLFNDHISRLIQMERVEVPKFDFVTGSRKEIGHDMKLEDGELLIIEGIHALNDRLTASIPKWRKFKIYVSALTHLNIDDHSKIPATDVRLLRRLVRDYFYRGSDAKFTLDMWPKVRRGEYENIFPFQEDADEFFNSSFPYELSVLRKYSEPLLKSVSKSDICYSDAKRLRRFLTYIIPEEGAEEYIPQNSIIREFIGGSCF